MAIQSIYSCSTIDDLIAYNKTLEISHNKLHLKASFTDNYDNKIIFNYTSLIEKYRYFLQSKIKLIELTDNEYLKYKFKPKMLSADFYGTTELWSSIMRINNLMSITEFTLKKLKLFTSDIMTVLNEILIIEEKNIKENICSNSL